MKIEQAAVETVKNTVTASSILSHLKNNRIEYLGMVIFQIMKLLLSQSQFDLSFLISRFMQTLTIILLVMVLIYSL
jgi:hypothetical protein